MFKLISENWTFCVWFLNALTNLFGFLMTFENRTTWHPGPNSPFQNQTWHVKWGSEYQRSEFGKIVQDSDHHLNMPFCLVSRCPEIFVIQAMIWIVDNFVRYSEHHCNDIWKSGKFWWPEYWQVFSSSLYLDGDFIVGMGVA